MHTALPHADELPLLRAAAPADAIRENGKPLANAGLKARASERGAIPVELQAGTYKFDFELPPPPPVEVKPLFVWEKEKLPKLFDGKNFIRGESAGFLDTLSLTLWVRPETLENDWNPILFTDHANASAFHFSLRGNGTPTVAINSGAGWIYGPASWPVVPGSWHHVAVVCDSRKSGSIRLFIDGKAAGEQALDLGMPLDLNAYCLGANIGWAGEPEKNFHGSMADVRLYRGLLTEHEIEKIMSETPMGKAK